MWSEVANGWRSEWAGVGIPALWSCGPVEGGKETLYSRDGSRHGRDSEGSMRGVSERKGQSAGEHQQVLKKLREAS